MELKVERCSIEQFLQLSHLYTCSELEESLLVMPFHFATDLLVILDVLIRQKKSVELVTKCLLFLMR